MAEDLEKILDKYNLTEKELNKILKDTKKKEPTQYNKVKLPINEKRIKFTVISDTHIGHKEYKPKILEHAILLSKQEGSEFFLHCGDIIEGMSGREGHVYELSHIGATNQMNHAVEQLSQVELPIYAITATNSHDGWFSSKNNMGFEIGYELDNKIDNFIFLGYDEVDIELDNKLKLRMTHPGDGCYDDKTEVLTNDGWKLFKDLNKTEKVATLNPKTHNFEWQKPKGWVNSKYSGEMIHFKSRTVDLMVTPKHNMFVRKYYKTYGISKFKLISAEDLLKNNHRQKWQFTRVCNPVNISEQGFVEIPHLVSKNKGMLKRMVHIGKIPVDDFAELVAWYVTEGNIRKTCISIAQHKSKNPENYEQIIDLFKRLGIKISEEERKQHINVYSKELADFLTDCCGSGSRNKHLPKWLKEESREVLETLFFTMVKGDGWLTPTGFAYKSISKRLRDDFSEIAIKLGYAVNISNDIVTVSSIQVNPTINTEPEKVSYNRTIHCVTVPNGVILVKRNNKVCWCGNTAYAISYKMQKYINALSGGQKPNLLFQGHYHKAMQMFYRNVHAFDAGCLQSQTIFMKKKQTPAMTGYWMIDVATDKKGSVSRLKSEFIPFYD